ncbi:MAG: Flagellar hook-associated protein 2 [Syntrophorhabdaceae bacterium PtaU1.Bin034]|nr:MAG: Flagellar hook-associated protein 2 [Syntrophorhabdaceae bacterium PtaU1.Bin034]
MSSTSSISSALNLTGLLSDIDWQQVASDISAAQKTAQITPLTDKKTAQENRLSAWQSFNTLLSAVTNYINTSKLNEDEGYESFSAALTSSDTSITADDIVSVSIGTGTLRAGTYSIEVSQLAQAEKISSDSIASTSTALGISGNIIINGTTISIDESDSLNGVVRKINSANAGVTASILNVSDADHRLMLQSASQGAESISLANGGTANVLEALSLTNQSLSHASGSDALSDTFSDSTIAIGTLLGMSSPQSGAVQITGTDGVSQNISIDLAVDSLQGVADKINAAGITGVTASVEETTEDGITVYSLRLTSVDAADLADGNNVLQAIGILKEMARNVVQEGKDALLKIDGYDIISSSNTLTGAIDGITLKLTGTNENKPVTLEIAQDNSGLSDKVNTLVSDINSALAYIKDQNTYISSDSSSSSSKPLMGDVSLSGIKQTITTILFGDIKGNETYKTAASIGISFGSDGTLSLDADKFSAALSDNPDEVLNAVKSLSTGLYNGLNVYADPYSGTIKSIEDTISTRIDEIEDQIEEVEARCDRQAELLQKRFSALEVLIAQSNQTQDWLEQMTNAKSND